MRDVICLQAVTVLHLFGIYNASNVLVEQGVSISFLHDYGYDI